MLQRVATFMLVKEGMEGPYREAHRAVWPEILSGIERAGIGNYSIFMMGRQLFSYFEVKDLEKSMAIVRADTMNQEWQQKMAPLMEINSGMRNGSTMYLDEVFHID